MKQFWVEGLVQPHGHGKKLALVEPFSKAYWAETSAEALKSAEADLNGGGWGEGGRRRPHAQRHRPSDVRTAPESRPWAKQLRSVRTPTSTS